MGYTGRMVLFEFVPMTDNLRREVKLNLNLDQFRKNWRMEGGKSLVERGLPYIAKGELPYDVVASFETDTIPGLNA
jgi:type II secretory ATPase GspE/PulE/Tfp pilus assembly ATPase PilB-like protein